MDALRWFTEWHVNDALPFWSTAGFDAQRGRFHERLDQSGNPLDVPHRSMVQARQIFVFSRAHQLGWCAAGAARAELGMAGLERDFCREDATEASFAFSITRDGAVVSDVADAYAHAFVLFAIAAFHSIQPTPRLLELARKTNVFIKRRLRDPIHGGLFDVYPIGSRGKRQNPVMHLLEAYLALERSAPGAGFIDDAQELVRLFATRLFRPDDRVLLEHFQEDWSPAADLDARRWEPGHHFEWVWLLREYQLLSGEDTRDLRDRLYQLAQLHGVNDVGLIHDEVDPALAPVRKSHRVWPHTEAIKAALVQHDLGVPGAHELANQMAGSLAQHFLNRPFRGGWIDHVSDQGAPLVDYVPASSLYHLFFAATEIANMSTLSAPTLPTDGVQHAVIS